MGSNLKTLKKSGLIDEFYSIQLTGSGAVAELENKIASYYRMKHALCVSNATTGLLGLALTLGLKDSEFITSPYTYGGTVSSWLMLNNSIIFADIEPRTATLNPGEIPQIITAKTKAVLAADILGNPSDTKTIRKIADDFGLWYIADAAQSFGAQRDGCPASHLADALVISFTNGKTLFAGEGGAIVTDNSDLYEKLLWHTQHPFRQKRELGLDISNEFSFNGRINPMAAIWANANFEKALKRLKNYQKKCSEVIECLDKSGLTVTADFKAERILPSFSG
ncbi:MAG TPA: DegT/DnrJ/EryC1/StrS family aminotransferase [Pyrinomonadaceae bacterium]|nr:DegT/DnrJ/EryC1/StrS family aminotransferase [Pyrinomonadaceae bacterium]